MSRILHLALVACALPHASPAQAPRGLARQALADSSLQWIARRTPNLRVYFLAGTYAARHQDSLIGRVTAARAHDLEILGRTRYDGMLYVFFLETRPQMEHLLGRRATGFAERSTGSIFLMTNLEWRGFERHEIMHVLAIHDWGQPVQPSAWLEEGFAQFADGDCGGYPIDPVVVGLANGHSYVPLDSLMTRFRELNDLTAYLQAASFVGYLYRAHGRDAVQDIWQHGISQAAERLHRTPAELYRAWAHQLPPPATHPTPQEIAAIREKGCG